MTIKLQHEFVHVCHNHVTGRYMFSIQTSNKDGYGNHNITRWFVKSHCEGLSLDLLV